MPRSHTCPSCLTELARVRAVPDPHYGLPVVVCPSCARASVRTRHPDIEFWRGFRRTRSALQVVFAKTMLIVWCAIFLGVMIVKSTDVFTPRGHLDVLAPLLHPDPLEAAYAAGMLILAVVLVLIARLLMTHKRLFVPITILMVLTLVVVCLDSMLGVLGTLLADLGSFPSRHSIPQRRVMVGRFERFGMFAAVGMLGLLLAPVCRRSIDNSTKRRFRKLLRKRRKQRSTND